MVSSEINYNFELPYPNCSDFEIEDDLLSSRRRIMRLMDDDRVWQIIRQKFGSDFFECEDIVTCRYVDEDDFCRQNNEAIPHLNVFSMNIRSLIKHMGELSCLLQVLGNDFDIIILSEIGSRNLSLAQNLFPNHEFYFKPPKRNYFGGVAVYINKNMTEVRVLSNLEITMNCNCVKCEVESLFLQFKHFKYPYIIGAIYRHPNGSIEHFVEALERSLGSITSNISTIIAGDINIDLIQTERTDVSNYVSLMLSNKFMPNITLPTRITSHSATCIDHMFIRNLHKVTTRGIFSGILYCDISDHLPCILSIKYDQRSMRQEDRPYVRLYGTRNNNTFIESMRSVYWNGLYTAEIDWYAAYMHKVTPIYNNSFPLVKLSRKRAKDKPWITTGLKRSTQENNKLYKISIRKGDYASKAAYNSYKRIYRRCLKQAETNYYNDIF